MSDTPSNQKTAFDGASVVLRITGAFNGAGDSAL